MIISLIILGLLILNIYRGYQDGLVYEFIRIISYLIGWLIAMHFARPLGAFINQFLGANVILINGISFLIVLIIAVMVLKAIGRVLNRITDFPGIHLLNSIGGAFVGALVGYVIVFILLTVCLALPSASIQNEYVHSPIAMKIVNNTPGSHLTNQWLK